MSPGRIELPSIGHEPIILSVILQQRATGTGFEPICLYETLTFEAS